MLHICNDVLNDNGDYELHKVGLQCHMKMDNDKHFQGDVGSFDMCTS